MSAFAAAPKTYHVGLGIAGTLRQTDCELDGIIANNGRDLTGQEVRIFLSQLKQGNPALTVFTGDTCDNQNERGECQGHPVTEENC